VKHVPTTALVAVALMICGSVPATAAPSGPVGVPPSPLWLFGTEPTEMAGRRPTASIDFTVPPGWAAPDGAALVVDYQINTTATATMTVEVNETQIDDLVLDAPGGTATIQVPANLILPGENSVRLAANIDLTISETCVDPTHPSRKFTLGASSHLSIPMAPVGVLALTDVPAALEPLGGVDRVVNVHLVGPFTGELASAAALVVSAVREAATPQVAISVASHSAVEFDETDLNPDRPSIVIGRLESLGSSPTYLGLHPVDLDTQEPGLIAVTRGIAGGAVLTVSGSTDLAVEAAAQAFADPARRTGFVGTQDTVAIENIPVAGRPVERQTLADLDYPDRTLDGPGRASTTYGFDIPIDRISPGALVAVNAQRSSGSDQLEGVGVSVNGKRVGVVSFGADGRTTDEPIQVPSELLRPGRNVLKLDADFVGEPTDCAGSPPPQSVEVSAATTIDLDGVINVVDMDLDDLPYTFRSPSDSERLSIVLPKAPSDAEISAAIELADLLGADDHPARVTASGELDETDTATNHLVVLGTPTRQPLIARLAAIPGSGIAPDDITSLVAVDAPDGSSAAARPAGTSPADGVIRFVPSSTPSSRLVLVVSGLDDGGTNRAIATLLDIDRRDELVGYAATLHTSGVDSIISSTGTSWPQLVQSSAPAATGPTPTGSDAPQDSATTPSTNATNSPGSGAPDPTSSSEPEPASAGIPTITSASAKTALRIGSLAALGIAGGVIFLVRRRRTQSSSASH
jgi:Bacterial cellulose synthase subunit